MPGDTVDGAVAQTDLISHEVLLKSFFKCHFPQKSANLSTLARAAWMKSATPRSNDPLRNLPTTPSFRNTFCASVTCAGFKPSGFEPIQRKGNQCLALPTRFGTCRPLRASEISSAHLSPTQGSSLIFKAHRLMYRSTLGSRVTKKRRRFKPSRQEVVLSLST